jgi:hypothetical protein
MAFQLVKKKIYPNVHVLEHKFNLTGDSASAATQATIYPVIMQDEGQGDPNSKYTNPESASFAESNEPNCYPDSRVNYARCNIELGLRKHTYDTDKVEVMKVMVVPIYTSFLEDLTATNDVTSEEVEDILELQHETTDRQTYPLWNGSKLNGDITTLGTDVPGLTTNQGIEGVTFDVNKLYDALQFYKNGGKLRGCIGKIRTLNVSKRRNIRLSYKIRRKTKRMNPYTFFGVLILVPDEASVNQMTVAGELSAGSHITVRAVTRYNEWNENFNFMR